MSFQQVLVDGVDGVTFVADVIVSPDGKNGYTAAFPRWDGTGQSAVAVFARENASAAPACGDLTFVEAHFDNTGGVDGIEDAGALALDPSGSHLYVGSASTGDWIGAFSRDAVDGTLTCVESHFYSDYDFPDNYLILGYYGVGSQSQAAIAVSPEGTKVFVSNPDCGALAMFSLDETTGGLCLDEYICSDSLRTTRRAIGPVVDLTVYPDGGHLYSAGGALWDGNDIFGNVGVIDYTTPKRPEILFNWNVIQGAID